MSAISNVGINSLSGSIELNLGKTQSRLQSEAGSLSSGLRIQTAADDPSGLAIAETLQSRVNGYDQAVRNTQDATNALTVADGALQTITDILQRLRNLTVQANSDILSPGDRSNIQTESVQLQAEINTIAENTNFNGSQLLNAKPYNHPVLTIPDGTFATIPPLGGTVFNPTTSAWTFTASGFGHEGIWTAPDAQTAFNVQNVPSGSTQVAGVQGNGNPIFQNISGFKAGATYALTFNIAQALNGPNAPENVRVFVNGAQVGSYIPVAANPANPDWQPQITATFTPGPGTHAIAFQGFTNSNAWALIDNVQISEISGGPDVGPGPHIGGAALTLHAGADEGDVVTANLPTVFTSNLRISLDNVSTTSAASIYQVDIDAAIDSITGARATIGAQMVALQIQATNSDTAALNLTASESNIRDANVAKKMTAFTQDAISSNIGSSLLLNVQKLAASIEILFR